MQKIQVEPRSRRLKSTRKYPNTYIGTKRAEALEINFREILHSSDETRRDGDGSFYPLYRWLAYFRCLQTAENIIARRVGFPFLSRYPQKIFKQEANLNYVCKIMLKILTDHKESDGDVVAARGSQRPEQSSSSSAHEADDADAEDGPAHRWRAQTAALLWHGVPATTTKIIKVPPIADLLTHTRAIGYNVKYCYAYIISVFIKVLRIVWVRIGNIGIESPPPSVILYVRLQYTFSLFSGMAFLLCHVCPRCGASLVALYNGLQ